MKCWKQLVIIAGLLVICNGQLNNMDVLRYITKTRKLPSLDVCGVMNPFYTRIINGENAALEQFPWMVRIGLQVNFETIFWFCGGSLITDHYIITAAHCLEPSFFMHYNTKKFIVRLGDLDLDPSQNDEAVPIDYEISQKDVILHDYNSTLMINDIALVKLRTKVEFTNKVRPICLPPREFYMDMFISHKVIIAGWGATNPYLVDKQESHLKYAEIEIQDTESCRKHYAALNTYKKVIINDKVICASLPGKDSCSGDSGGPLMFPKKRNNSQGESEENYFLMGIVSYGHACAVREYPGVYTCVSKHMKWFIDNMNL